MNYALINGLRIYSFTSRPEIIQYAASEKKSLIALNAEKILHANDQTRALVNRNIGYADGYGAVWALRKKGFTQALKIPGCELWLDIVRQFSHSKSFYLVGAAEPTIRETVTKLQVEFPGIRIPGDRNG
jgi:UDP-N-acetyl-D-mannosaminouronate:lipid I N-acetyl-D-mannosaminouronosyltransferase